MNTFQWYELGKMTGNTDLIFTINTNLGTGASMTIPTKTGTKNYSVNWGDGNISTGQTGNATHTYSVHGIYQIRVTGTFLGFRFNNTGDRLKLVSIDDCGDIEQLPDYNSSFYGCSNLISIADPRNKMNNVTIGTTMFGNCTSLTTLPDNWTLGNLQNTNTMFFNCTSLTTLPEQICLRNNFISGTNMFLGTTLNTTRYSKFIIDTRNNIVNNNLVFHGGNSKYNSTAVADRTYLTTTKGWTITDGGLE